jgi:hypothetical protein
MGEVETPTLIQFGEKDTSVPTSQGWEHYRALQILDRAPVRFLLYPGQGHGLEKLSYQRRKIEEEVAWIQQHLRGAPPRAVPVRKEGSPLDLALGRRDLVDASGRVGETVDGVLVPPLGGRPLASGAFLARVEVTRGMLAQMLVDDPGSGPAGLVGWDSADARFAPGTQDLPATGMAADVAVGFARWLGSVTGTTWRLPTTAELEEAMAQVDPDPAENTLCRWAGYEPTFDEARRLRAAMLERDDPARWLLPVAASGARADLPWFDLHGNAAEYAVDAEGEVVIRGRCALDGCAEPRPALGSPPPALIGFRLVREDVAGKGDGE